MNGHSTEAREKERGENISDGQTLYEYVVKGRKRRRKSMAGHIHLRSAPAIELFSEDNTLCFPSRTVALVMLLPIEP